MLLSLHTCASIPRNTMCSCAGHLKARAISCSHLKTLHNIEEHKSSSSSLCRNNAIPAGAFCALSSSLTACESRLPRYIVSVQNKSGTKAFWMSHLSLLQDKEHTALTRDLWKFGHYTLLTQMLCACAQLQAPPSICACIPRGIHSWSNPGILTLYYRCLLHVSVDMFPFLK